MTIMLMLACGILTMIVGVALGGMVLEITMQIINRYLDERTTTEAIPFRREMQRHG